MGQGEQQELLSDFNTIPANYSGYTSVLSLFGKQVEANPDGVALRYANTTMTYGQLEERSNRLAYYLTDQYNVRPGELVGIMADRSGKMIIAILGILKAGGAYVPIDPAYPRARREYIITDTAIGVLIRRPITSLILIITREPFLPSMHSWKACRKRRLRAGRQHRRTGLM